MFGGGEADCSPRIRAASSSAVGGNMGWLVRETSCAKVDGADGTQGGASSRVAGWRGCCEPR